MANSPVGTKNRPYQVVISYQNGESSSAIPVGTPVVLDVQNVGKVGDGFQVVLPATAAANPAASLAMGIACNPSTWSAGQYNDVIVGGWAPNAKVIMASRSATSANWASFIANNVGDALSVDTARNALVYATTANATAIQQFILCDSWASYTTIASQTADTTFTWANTLNTDLTIVTLAAASTVATVSARVFVHIIQ